MARIVDPEEREVAALSTLVDFDGMDVLDVGCGTGRTARRIARTAASVTGVDPDPDRIAEARATPGEHGSCEVEYLADDAVTLALSDATFDAVVFSRSL